MQPSPACAASLALMLAVLLAAPTARGQTAPTNRPAEVAAQNDADPLTPKAEEKPAPAAPDASAADAPKKVVPAAERHPAIAALLDKLGTVPATEQATLATFYKDYGQPLWTSATGLSSRGTSVATELAKAADYGLDSPTAYRIPAAPSSFADPGEQAEHEIAVSLAVLTYAKHARGGRLDPAKISATIDMKPQPYEPVSVLESTAKTEDAGAKLRGFHPRHVGFRTLQKAYVAAREAKLPADKLVRIQVNLERWRWMPDDVGAFHVKNNVPEQLTRVVKHDKVVFTEKIVVGKPGHSTPVMSADMLYVIFHPSWGVPNGIKTNEVAPMLKRASARNDTFFGEGGGRATSALARHELRVYQNGREVNADQVDWRTADIRQFHFTQAPSAKNVLGVVKFRFPNKYDVYMHDTQEKHLFGQAVRAYSHGCMRVQNPLALAEVLLAHDRGWTMDRVQAAVKSGRSSDITLNTPVPVHLTYFTATADDAGNLSFHGDIYGMDTRVASALAGKPIALAAAAVSTQQAAPRPPRAREAGSGSTWSPFSLSAN